MRVIILAAGKGTRLKPLTNDKPKCMVELNKKSLIKYQLDLFEKFHINDINVVTGYLHQKIDFSGIKKFYNPNFDTTNMVTTLFCANKLFDGEDDILIAYGDIIYNENVLKSIIDANDKINIVVDKDWKIYWSQRMDNPLEDAETLKIDDYGYIKELGKKPISYDDIEAQYIGLIKIRKDVVKKVKIYYENLDKNALYEGQDFDNMYMTSFLQMVANNLIPLMPVYIHNGWMEVDTPSDLHFSHFLELCQIDNSLDLLSMIPKQYRSRDELDSFTLLKPKVSKNYFSTELFLYNIYNKKIDLNNQDTINKLDIICKKIDVPKKVFICYTKDLAKTVDTTHIGSAYEIYLCAILLYLSDEKDDMKLLNSVLKMLDGVLETDTIYPSFFSIWAEEILHRRFGCEIS